MTSEQIWTVVQNKEHAKKSEAGRKNEIKVEEDRKKIAHPIELNPPPHLFPIRIRIQVSTFGRSS